MEEQDEGQSEFRELEKEKKSGFRKIGSLIGANWPKYLIEILVIIIGITLSFFIDNYREETNRRELERVYLKNLLTDINDDIEKLNNTINASKHLISSAKYMLKLSGINEAKEVYAEEFTRNFGGMLYEPVFISSNETFNDLKSGNSHIIVDSEIRSSLLRYYSFYDLIKTMERNEREERIALLQPFLFRNFYSKGFDSEESGKGIILPTGGDWKVVVNDKMFINIATTRVLVREVLIGQYEEALVLAKKVKDNLKRND